MMVDALRGCRLLTAFAGLSLAALGGCAAYNPGQLSAMSAVDLCELEHLQGRNLSPAAKQAIQGELQRRNDNCGNHAVEVAQRYQALADHQTYGMPDDP